jgi:polar amino acid transport system substrate-binding protein
MQKPDRASLGWSALAIILLALTGLAALGMRRWRTGDSWGRIQEQSLIRIGYAEEAPYAFLDPSGDVTGAMAETAKRISAQLGIRRVQWQLIEFNDLLAELEDGRIDMVATGMFVTPERSRRVAFSLPVCRVQAGLLVRKGNPLALHSYADAAGPTGAAIAVIPTSVQMDLLGRTGIPSDRLKPVPDARTGLAAVASGIVDCLALSAPAVRWLARYDVLGRTEVARPFHPGPGEAEAAPMAFVFRKEDRRLREAWNAGLRPLLGTEEQRGLVAPFGLTRAELPPAVGEAGP